MYFNSLLYFITKVIIFGGLTSINYHSLTENELPIKLANRERASICPNCHQQADKAHQSHRYRVRDIPLKRWIYEI